MQLLYVFTSCPVANGDLAVCLSVSLSVLLSVSLSVLLSVRLSVLCGRASPPRPVTAALLLKRSEVELDIVR